MSDSAHSRIKPPALRSGDTVGIVAPGSNIRPDLLQAGCRELQRLGYKTFYLDSIFDHDLYFSGSVKRRAGELQEMFEREEVRAIICARGGYGCNYLLEELDLSKIQRHPKIFIGYSDVTTLLTWFADAGRMITFHGPMVTKDFAADGGVHLPSWQSATSGRDPWELVFKSDSGVQPLVPGDARGTLYGGCLSMVVASLATPYEIQTRDTILFLEDVCAKPFQIDRMLMQLKLAGKFEGVRGLIFGEMLDCIQPGGQAYPLTEVIQRVVGDLGVPIAYGVRSGHVSRDNITLPIGVNVALTVTADNVNLKVLESATRPAAAPASSAKS
jgi:muramoyltetrapeptide carboxypeptidase